MSDNAKIITIRKAVIDDLYAVSEMWVKLMKESSKYNISYLPAPKADEALYNYYLSMFSSLDRTFNIFVAETNNDEYFSNRLVGFVEAYVSDGNKRFDKKIPILANIYVDKKYRNLGIGKTMCEVAAYWFKNLGYDKIELSYLPDFESTRHFWEKRGIRINLVTGVVDIDNWIFGDSSL